MASTFRRKRPASASVSFSTSSPSLSGGLRGTRPWTGGVTLTSTGLSELDTILSGGQALSSCLYMNLDRWTALGTSIMHYWCAQALAHGQTLWIPTVTENDVVVTGDSPRCTSSVVQDLLQSLPKDLHLEKARKQASSHIIKETTIGLGALEEDEGEDDDNETAVLNNAWQYSKQVQDERSGLTMKTKSATVGVGAGKATTQSTVFCHSFNLAGRLGDQIDDLQVKSQAIPSAQGASLSSSSNLRSAGVRYFSKLKEQLDDLFRADDKNKRNVVRLLLLHPNPGILSVALGLLLAHIRTQSLPVVVMIAIQPWRYDMSMSIHLTRLQRLSDIVLEIEGFVGRNSSNYPPPAEFSTVQGLLHVNRCAPLASSSGHFADLTVSSRPAAFVYGLRRDSRKLHISMLHIPPEDYAAGGGSVGSGVRSGAGLAPPQQAVGGCSSAGHLDF